MFADLIQRWEELLASGPLPVIRQVDLPGEGPLVVLRQAAARVGAPRILLSAGIHGDEPAGTECLYEKIKQDRLSPAVEWIIVPFLNPGGLRMGTRENPRGLDLNREFLRDQTVEIGFYKETIPAQGPYDLMLSLHEDWEFQGSYLYEINTGKRPSMAEGILNLLAAETGLAEAEVIDDHKPILPGLIVHDPVADEPENWPEAIFMIHQQPLLSYTLETPSQAPLPKRVQCMHGVIDYCAERLVCETGR
ncbi:MAG: M14 family metallocarboxypeptidase [Opitutales bacterium]|nr:M14 family metallocarboxypeptidase [Opitutales bacterium]